MIIDLPDHEKFCRESGQALHRIGEEVTEQLDIVPAKVQVIRTIRPKYACSCGDCVPKSMQLPSANPQEHGEPRTIGLYRYLKVR